MNTITAEAERIKANEKIYIESKGKPKKVMKYGLEITTAITLNWEYLFQRQGKVLKFINIALKEMNTSIILVN